MPLPENPKAPTPLPAEATATESFRPDELDLPSGVAITDEKTGVSREVSFRELHEFTKREIRLWDSLETRDRLTVQRHQDPNYKPLQPYDGGRGRPRRATRS